MKFGVVIFPGSNCDQDMVYTLREIHGQEVVELWHKDSDLQNVDGVVLPGGFSYGDYLRSGALAKFSPIMKSVIDFANNGGFVLGICNGFQVLCETGLLPGALLHNDNQKFICRPTYIVPATYDSAVTRAIPRDTVLNIPIAHGEGRYYADDDTIRSLHLNDQILFKYADENGQVTQAANPNGSIENIAGICNVGRNVFGMMPHPERASDPETGNTDGHWIFESILQTME